jgi:hypothetical protein
MTGRPDQGGLEYRRMDGIKSLLVELGARCNGKTMHLVTSAVNYLEVGHWMKANGFHTRDRVRARRDLFHRAADKVGDRKVLYLEFGVARGNSMRYWSHLLSNPASALHGFDTFEGLPEDWRLSAAKGAYAAGGRTPEISDSRVTFYKGLFQQTLPSYSPPSHENLIINIDCDLYSATSFVLNSLAPHIRPGSFIYFDEFGDPRHEMRAFQEFLAASQKRFSLLAATLSYGQVLFECV